MSLLRLVPSQLWCEECQKAREEHESTLIYTFYFDQFDLSVGFHVQRARAFMRQYLAAYQALLIGYGDARADEFLQQRVRLFENAQLREWIERFSAVNFRHLTHIPRDRLNEPGILLDFGPESVPDRWRDVLLSVAPGLPKHSILMDGNHRGAIAAAAGEDYPVYVLPQEEQRAVFCQFGRGNLAGVEPK